jgi:hypothetical protein
MKISSCAYEIALSKYLSLLIFYYKKKMMGNIYFLLDKYIYYGIRINKLFCQSCILDLIFIYLNYILNSLIKISLN